MDAPDVIDLGPLADRVSVTPQEVCAALPVGTTKLYELLGRGELASYRVGKARRILVSSIRAYVKRHLDEGKHLGQEARTSRVEPADPPAGSEVGDNLRRHLAAALAQSGPRATIGGGQPKNAAPVPPTPEPAPGEPRAT